MFHQWTRVPIKVAFASIIALAVSACNTEGQIDDVKSEDKAGEIYLAMEEAIKEMGDLDKATMERYLALHEVYFARYLSGENVELSATGFQNYLEKLSEDVEKDFSGDRKTGQLVIVMLGYASLKGLYGFDKENRDVSAKITSLIMAKLVGFGSPSYVDALKIIKNKTKALTQNRHPQTLSILAKDIISQAKSNESLKAEITSLLKELIDADVSGSDADMAELIGGVLAALNKVKSELGLSSDALRELGEDIFAQIEAGLDDKSSVADQIHAESGVVVDQGSEDDSGDQGSSVDNTYTLTLALDGVSPSSISANGTDTTVLKVTALDSSSLAKADLDVSLVLPANGGSLDAVTKSTNASGEATFTLTSSTTVGSYDIKATADSGSVESAILTVDFTALCSAAMIASSPFANWSSGGSVPAGNAADPVLICTAAQLNRIADANTYDTVTLATRMSYHYKLMGDIDMNGVTPNIIGLSSDWFLGTFDGNNFKIENVTVNDTSSNYKGLFGIIHSGSVVKNLTVENVSVTGLSYVGVIGFAVEATVSDLNVINMSLSGVSFVGTIGRAVATTGSDITVTVNTLSATSQSGSFIGSGEAEAVAPYTESVFSNISVTGIAANKASTLTITGDCLGGIAGVLRGSRLSLAQASNLTANGDRYVGGMVGCMYPENTFAKYSYLQDSFADVDTNTTDRHNSGAVGRDNTNDSIFSRIIAVGTVCSSGCGLYDGIISYGPPDGTSTDMFFDSQTTGATSIIGTGLTTAQLTQDLNSDGVVDGLEGTGFNPNVWELDPANLSGGYPRLK